MRVQHVEAALERKEALLHKMRRLGAAVEAGNFQEASGHAVAALEQEYSQSMAELKEVGGAERNMQTGWQYCRHHYDVLAGAGSWAVIKQGSWGRCPAHATTG